jgi:hypothetical protein
VFLTTEGFDMTYQQAANIVAEFAPKIGKHRMVHIDNARPLIGPHHFERMMDSGKTRFPRPGFVEPADIVTWLVIRGCESKCNGK